MVASRKGWKELRWPVAGLIASTAMLGVYAQVEAFWWLGFIALMPWLYTLSAATGWKRSLLLGWAMSMAFCAVVFSWFATAAGTFTGLGFPLAMTLLLIFAPLLQPQFLIYALARQWAMTRFSLWLGVLIAVSAWTAGEWLWPKLLGDTLGHGLLPAAWLRQAADLAGAGGLTLLLLLINESLLLAWQRRAQGWRILARPVATALGIVILWAGYGAWRLDAVRDAQQAMEQGAPPLRIGMVQSGIVDYERLREKIGAYGVVRHVLDTHFALSHSAVRDQGVDALLWSETVYPTTFGQAKSADGAALDAEIQAFVDAMGVPLVFGTYDRDAQGEYNAAAFLEPREGLLGFYRKTHPFPFTEHVPAWLDGPLLRRLLPWAGTWKAGEGARVLPLRTADGRMIDVVPLICLDDVHPQVAIDGVRLGAQAIVGMSNDSWFSADGQGSRLHLNVAAFRSIETRLPQLRVTNNGHSAIVDESGEIMVRTRMGDAAVLTGHAWARPPMPTLVVLWGEWLGKAALAFLLFVVAVTRWRSAIAGDSASAIEATTFDAQAVLLSRPLWVLDGGLRVIAALGLAWLLWGMWQQGFQVQSLTQIKIFLLGVVAPLCVSAVLRHRGQVRVAIAQNDENEHCLMLTQRGQRIEVPLASIRAVQAKADASGLGADITLASGRVWEHRLLTRNPLGLWRALNAAGVQASWGAEKASPVVERWWAAQPATPRFWFQRPLIKFALFPLLLSLPAFRLHQVIAFGGTFGEYQTYGLGAYVLGLGIWWCAWAIGLMLLAAGLRIVIETFAALMAGIGTEPRIARQTRAMMHTISGWIYFLGVPVWLLWRLLAA